MLVFAIVLPLSPAYTFFTGMKVADVPLWTRVARDGVFVLLAVVMAILALNRRTYRLWLKRVSVAMFVLLAYTLVRAVLSFRLSIPALWVGVRYYILMPALGLLVPAVIRDESDLRTLLGLAFGVSAAVAAVGLVAAFVDPSDLGGTVFNIVEIGPLAAVRATSTLAQPNSLATYLSIYLILWLSLRRHLDRVLGGWVGYLVALLLLLGIVLTFSRSAMIALLIVLGMQLAFGRVHWVSRVLGGLALLAAIPLYAYVSFVRNVDWLGNAFWIVRNDPRVYWWAELAERFVQLPAVHFLFGRGPGSNVGVLQTPGLSVAADLTGALATDNFYITAAYEVGLVGLIVVVGVAVFYTQFAGRAARSASEGLLRGLYRGLFLGLLFLLAQSGAVDGLRTLPGGFYFWALVGLLLAAHNIEGSGSGQGSAAAGPPGSPDKAAGGPVGHGC